MNKLDLQQIWRLVTYGENGFPAAEAQKSVRNHTIYAAIITLTYFILVFSMKFIMRNREPLKLDRALQVWNLIISIFSIIATYKLWTPTIEIIRNDGFMVGFECHSLTNLESPQEYWLYLLVLSKAVEFIDTFFIVLRKKPLIFLHWYHHMATFMFCVYQYPLPASQFRAGAILNVAVHAVMYPYYFARSLHFRVPGIVAKLVTTLQLVQFFVFLIGSVYHYYAYYFFDIYPCDSSILQVHTSTALNTSYFLLFANFFLKSYIVKGGKNKYKSQ